MDSHLRDILGKQGHHSHDTWKNDGLPTDIFIVVDTERVKDNS